MPLVPARRERVMVFGSWGAGKSYAHLTIARLYQRRGMPNRFFILDTEDAIEAMLSEFEDLNNIDVFPLPQVVGYPEYKRVVDEVISKAGAGDWVVIDSLTPFWFVCQEHYSNEVYKMDLDEYLLEMRKQKEGLKELRGDELKDARKKVDQKAYGGFGGYEDWQYIKKMHHGLIMPLIHGDKGRAATWHVFATAYETKMQKEDQETKENLDAFKIFGKRPEGEKHNPHHFHTIQRFSERGGERFMTTAMGKDRGRDKQDDVRFTDWAYQYLVRVAKWGLS